MVICYLGIGSNLGNRRKNITQALNKIKTLKQTTLLKASRLIQTKPVGGPAGQGKYLNAAIKIETGLAPRALLKELKKIEFGLGRKKTIRNGPRIIDLDILLYADRVINIRGIVVPHPRMFERDFVLRPLSQII